MKAAARVVAVVFTLGFVGLVSGACAKGAGTDPVATDAEAGPVCLLHSCKMGADCAGCSGGMTTCALPQGDCVAPMAPVAEAGPEAAPEASPPDTAPPMETGPSCPTDAQGNPTITCTTDANCSACDAWHQVCDPTMGKCVSCTATETQGCSASATCKNDVCVPACPTTCTTDSDCSACSGPLGDAHVCDNGHCGVCSATTPCAAPQQCTRAGTCANTCGSDGMGACLMDSDCAGCGASTSCHTPVNGGEGTCSVPAAGCSQLGGIGLPPPFSAVTNLCSTNADCAGVGVEYNVGALLRQITGISSIGDADVTYGMNVCAAITVSVGPTSISCGACVPCEVSTDCQNINVDQVASQAFGPLGPIVTNLVLNEIFGTNDHEIHMYCDPVAGGYGACVPCPSVVSSCGGN
jgi:hypothetical protein